MGLVRQSEEGLRELERRLRNELWSLPMCSDVEEINRRRTKLQTSLAIACDMLTEIAQRRARSA